MDFTDDECCTHSDLLDVFFDMSDLNIDQFYVNFGLAIFIPGHALHEKGLQRQIAVGTLVNSQQRRALAVPRLNR